MPSYDPTFFNIDPYYDDFSEDKKFLRMLFRPGFALQARELSQIQSILQNQLERFGNFVLDDGSMVFGGQVTEIPAKVNAISGLSGGGGVVVGELDDSTISLEKDGVTSYAKIIHGMKDPVTDEDVIYYQYLSGESVTGDVSLQGFYAGATFTASISGDVSDGLVIHVDEGIRYTNGYFVTHDAQKIGVYEIDGSSVEYETPNSSVGFNIKKSIVTSQQDISLRDPASGSYNFNAPGSDRFKIELEIAQRGLTASIDTAAADPFARTDFIEFARTVGGSVVKREKYPDLGELEETFARRTYDESGHYIVDPFELNMIPGPAADNLYSKLDSGKAYIFGYEFETQGSVKLTHNRARTTRPVGSDFVEYGYDVGPYILARFTNIADGASGLNFSTLPTIYFDSFTGITGDTSSYGTVDGVRFVVDAFDTENIFVPGATLYFDTDEATLTGGSSPGASAAVTGTIIRALGQTGFTTLVEVGPPYTSRSGWTEGTTAAFENALFYVAAGASFEDGSDVRTFTGSNVSFFSTTLSLSLTGGPLTNNIGSAKIRSIQRLGGSSHKLFLDDISFSDNRLLSNIRRIFIDGNTGNPAFYPDQIPTTLYAQGSNSLVYETPYGEVVKEFDDWDFLVNVVVEVSLSSGSGTKTISTSDIADFLQIGPNIAEADVYTPLENSQIVTLFTEDGVLTGELRITSSTSEPDTLNFQNVKLNGNSYDGIVKCAVACQTNGETYRSKSLTSQSSVTLTFTGPDEQGYYYSYFPDGGSSYRTDVASLSDVPASLTGYVLDNGQRDTYYDFSKIKVVSETLPSGSVTVNYYEHSNITNGPFVGGTGGSYEDYESIPSFYSNSGKTVDLRNSLDFRPVRVGTLNEFSLTGPYVRPSYIYDNYGSGAKYSYYLPRIDKIILTRDKSFQIITGVPSETPSIPEDSPNAMTLYTVHFNPYTFDENDVTIIQEDNRRFTMRDIGNLERRIEKIEYYSTLSTLEQDAKSTPVYDDFGFERSKKAFVVDQFTGSEAADVSNKDFYCSFNKDTKELKPAQTISVVGIEDSPSVGSGLTQNNNICTFDYTTEEFISNKKYNNHRFVNSNSIVDFNGFLQLTPHADPWFSTTKKPALKTNNEGENDSWLLGKIGFEMNDSFWEHNWFGKSSSINKVTPKKTTLKRNTVRKPIGTSKITNFALPQSNLKVTPERVVDNTLVPYCRQKTIQLNASGLLPNKEHYIFFEDTQVATVTTDAYGDVTQNITITGDTHSVGKKLISIMDTNSGDITQSTSSAQNLYLVSGMSKDTDSLGYTRQLYTRKEASNSPNISNDPLTRDFQRKNSKSTRAKDNIAQLFSVSPDKYPSGLFLKKIDVYFHSLPVNDFDKNIPIRILLKPVVNGYPSTSKVIGTAYKYNITLDSDGKTTFELSNPTFIPAGDYAIELETNSSDYAVKTYNLPSLTNSSDSEERENVVDINFGSLLLPKNIGRFRKVSNEIMAITLHKCVFYSSSSSISYSSSPDASNSSSMKSNIQGSFIDPRYCEISYGGATYTPNTNESIKNSTSGTIIDINLSFINSDVSPAIDLETTNFVISSNVVSSSVSPNENKFEDANDVESESDTGYRNKTYSRYVTKTIKTLQSANNVHVLFDKYQPAGTNIRVYLKRLTSNALTKFENQNYIEITPVSQNTTANISERTGDYIPAEYKSINDLEDFNTFAIKIVFTSNSKQIVPSIKNLKVVAV